MRAVRAAASADLEIGIHPDVLRLDGYRQAAAPLLKLYPQATSTRSHSLTASARFYPEMHSLGLRRCSNWEMTLFPGLRPIQLEAVDRLHELPIYFSDAGYLVRLARNGGRFADCVLPELRLDQPGMKVFCFHAIHIYLNSGELAHYQAVRGNLQDVPRLTAARDLSRPGVRRLLIDLLGALAGSGIAPCRLDEVPVEARR